MDYETAYKIQKLTMKFVSDVRRMVSVEINVEEVLNSLDLNFPAGFG